MSATVSRPSRGTLVAFGGILVVLALVSTNLTIVGTALPRIIAELDGFELYAWAFTAFILTSTVTLPVFGRLSDTYGRKRLLLFGIVLFSLASAAAGFAATMPQLVALRAVQGLGGGALMAMTWAVMADLFTPRQRGAYQGYTSAVFGISAVVGPLVGGVITDTLGWRWVFFVNVPIALLAFEIVRRTLPEGLLRPRGRVDVVGALLLTLASVPLLLALSFGGAARAWTDPVTLALLGTSAAAAVAFALHERRVEAPILPPDLFRDRTFRVAALATGLLGAAMFAGITYLPLFVQGVAGGSAAASGFALAPLMGGFVVATSLSGHAVTRWGRYRPWILGGTVLTVLGAAAVAALDTGSGPLAIALSSALLGLGLGPTMTLYVLAVQNVTVSERMGTVTSAIQFFRQIGGMVGVAVAGTVVTLRLGAGLATAGAQLAGASGELAELVTSANTLTEPARLERLVAIVTDELGAASVPAVVGAMRGALADGIALVFVGSAALAAVAVGCALRLPERPLSDRPEARGSPGARGDAAATEGAPWRAHEDALRGGDLVDDAALHPRPAALEREGAEIARGGVRDPAVGHDLVRPPRVGRVPHLEARGDELAADPDGAADGPAAARPALPRRDGRRG